MVKSNNKGFSLVEIIIAAAVFAILVYPITRALMMSVNTDNQSTKKQYAVEKAEEIMEGFKTADLSSYVSVADTNKAGNRYTFNQSASEARYVELPSTESEPRVDYTKSTYECDGQIAIGESYEKYDCTVEINDAAYQVMKKGYVLKSLTETEGAGNADTAEFKEDGSSHAVKTEISSSGTVRNLDSNKVALIASATYTGKDSNVKENNLDNKAYQYFKSEKAKVLEKHSVWYSQYLSGSDFFSDDFFSKNTTIEISKNDANTKYVVTCKVKYTDKTSLSIIQAEYESETEKRNVYEPSSFDGDGVVYQQEFDELPPVYLLYVPAICNGAYCPIDTITIDNKLTDEKDNVKLYILQTVSDLNNSNDEIAKRYRQIICKQFGVNSLNDITYVSSKTTTGAKDIKVRTNLAEHSNSSNLDIFANFDVDKTNSDFKNVKPMKEDDSEEVYMYDIKVTLTDSKGNKTVVTGTRGK